MNYYLVDSEIKDDNKLQEGEDCFYKIVKVDNREKAEKIVEKYLMELGIEFYYVAGFKIDNLDDLEDYSLRE